MEDSTEQRPLTSKEKRALYMAQLRGSMDSEYRIVERQNNARAMRKKREENAHYRERERRQNRAHMAEIRRQNSEYRQQEHMRNRHRMALKRHLTSSTSIDHPHSSINPIYQILENNLQSSHISFIPYQSNTIKSNTEYELLQQIDEYCRLHETHSNADSNSRSLS